MIKVFEYLKERNRSTHDYCNEQRKFENNFNIDNRDTETEDYLKGKYFSNKDDERVHWNKCINNPTIEFMVQLDLI